MTSQLKQNIQTTSLKLVDNIPILLPPGDCIKIYYHYYHYNIINNIINLNINNRSYNATITRQQYYYYYYIIIAVNSNNNNSDDKHGDDEQAHPD